MVNGAVQWSVTEIELCRQVMSQTRRVRMRGHVPRPGRPRLAEVAHMEVEAWPVVQAAIYMRQRTATSTRTPVAAGNIMTMETGIRRTDPRRNQLSHGHKHKVARCRA